MNSSETKIGLLLLGAGGHGRVVADIAAATGWVDVAFLDDRWPALSWNLAWPVLGAFEDLAARAIERPTTLVTMGGNRSRLPGNGGLFARRRRPSEYPGRGGPDEPRLPRQPDAPPRCGPDSADS